MQVTFNTKEDLKLENSFGIIKTQDNVELKVTISIREDGRGWFEVYDTETKGDNWYAQGELWFNGMELTDYDGVFSLPTFIISKLKELGYDASYAE